MTNRKTTSLSANTHIHTHTHTHMYILCLIHKRKRQWKKRTNEMSQRRNALNIYIEINMLFLLSTLLIYAVHNWVVLLLSCQLEKYMVWMCKWVSMYLCMDWKSNEYVYIYIWLWQRKKPQTKLVSCSIVGWRTKKPICSRNRANKATINATATWKHYYSSRKINRFEVKTMYFSVPYFTNCCCFSLRFCSTRHNIRFFSFYSTIFFLVISLEHSMFKMCCESNMYSYESDYFSIYIVVFSLTHFFLSHCCIGRIMCIGDLVRIEHIFFFATKNAHTPKFISRSRDM